MPDDVASRLSGLDGAALWEAHDALVRLTGYEPVLPLDGNREDAAREAWAGWDGTVRPRIESLELLDATSARMLVADGQGRVGVRYIPGSRLPHQQVTVADQPVYRAAPNCGTCETSLRLLGWPPDRAARLSDDLRQRLADVPDLTTGLLDAAAALLCGLRSGHYLTVLADLDLVRVTEPAQSWLWRRFEWHAEDDRDPVEEPDRHWPGTAHFQLRDPIPGGYGTFGVVVPTVPLDDARSETVDRHAERIAAGERPAAVLLCWVEDKYARAEVMERFLVGVVLDGHHKLLAYGYAGVPARALLVFRVEDSWGPPGDRTRFIEETTAPLRVG